MGHRPFRPFLWLALAGRLAAVVVCLLAIGQCSKPTGPTTPTSPGPNPTPTPPGVPTPPVSVPGPETFVGAGDIADCGAALGDAEKTARLLDTIGGTVFTLGDNAYPHGDAVDFRNCYEPTWGRHKDRTRPTPGNHEYDTAGAAAYLQYFGAQAGPAGLGYYSYNLGAWHIISMNSDAVVALGGAQEQWLRGDLAANPSLCTLAYWHHPLFSSGLSGNNDYMKNLYRILYENNVDVVLNGHDHSYERFAEQDPNGRLERNRGIREFVVGTGGKAFYDFMVVKPNSEMKISGPGTSGVLKMTLMKDTYSWEFITVGRGTQDSGLWGCH